MYRLVLNTVKKIIKLKDRKKNVKHSKEKGQVNYQDGKNSLFLWRSTLISRATFTFKWERNSISAMEGNNSLLSFLLLGAYTKSDKPAELSLMIYTIIVFGCKICKIGMEKLDRKRGHLSIESLQKAGRLTLPLLHHYWEVTMETK